MKTSHIILEKTNRIFTTLLLWVFLAVSGTKAAVLLSQGSANVGGWGSTVSSGDTAYSSFTLALGGTITNVAWTGDVNLDYGVPGGFDVTFWSSNAGRAGTELSTQTIIGSAGATDTGTTVGILHVYNFSTSVAPFIAIPGTEYYLSIVAYSGQWYWEAASNGISGGYEYAIINNEGDYFSTGGQAFTLLGTETPPSLEISQTGSPFVVSWSIAASNYVLQRTSDLSFGSWVNVTNGISTNGASYAYTNLATGNMAYFRLQQQ